MSAAIPNASGTATTLAKREIPYRKILIVCFILTLPIVNPTVHGDGVGYYAYARAILIQHNLRFEEDWRHANRFFSAARIQADEQLNPEQYTPTGYVDNHFTVGPAILWAPFLIFAHLAVLLFNAAGGHVSADGFSQPYLVAMAFGTAFYGFLGLLLSFLLARKYVQDRWAFLATFGIWLATSLPVYMYFNPAWSHAHSAFVVALFLWYWHETRDSRTLTQWILLGALAGLMLDVYYANVMLFVILPFEAARDYSAAMRKATPSTSSVSQLLARHAAFAVTLLVCFLPTFIVHRIIYGSIFETGYIPISQWFWGSPYLLSVLFSSNHGLLSWTPLLLFAFIGLVGFWRSVPRVGGAFLIAAIAFYYFIASYPDWAGISSYGSRFFVSLTPLFILGFGVFLDRLTRIFRTRRAALAAACIFLACFVFWNAGLMFQWGTHLIPARGPISFPQMIRNQFLVVPRQIAAQFEKYLFGRKAMMQQIEQRDLEQLKQNPPPP